MIGSKAFSITDFGYPLKSSLFPTHLPNAPFPIKPSLPRTGHVRLLASLTANLPAKSKPNTNSSIPLQFERQEYDLSKRWREIQGGKDWKGLLDPLDPLLRSEILRYGEFAQVCYDAFDYDENSKYRGSCKFKKSKLFQESGLPNRGYEVTKYLYATSKSDMDIGGFFVNPKDPEDAWSKHSNWMGYVAVCNSEEEIKKLGRRDIVVAWRGTVTNFEWLEDLKDILVPSGLGASKVKVEKGFLHLYTSRNSKSRYNKENARVQLLKEIDRLVSMYEGEEISITITGHSLGGALALLSGYDIAQCGLTSKRKLILSKSQSESAELDPMFDEAKGKKKSDGEIPLTVITFGGPRVGNDSFKDRCEELKVKTLRIVNEKDVVPKAPGFLTNESLGPLIDFIDNLPWTYSHVGPQLRLTSDLSPFLQPSSNPGDHHNLEGYLHLLDGFHGLGKPFRSVTDRDPALVNKSCGFLRSNLRIPASWWQDQYKGLVQNERGKWVQPYRDEDQFH